MSTLTIQDQIGNAAAVISRLYGAVTRRAGQLRCSRQTVYDHAQQVQTQLDPNARQAELADLNEQIRTLADRLAAAQRHIEQAVLCDAAKLHQVAAVAFAAGLSLRQIEHVFTALLPQDRVPDHSTIGRWVADEAEKATRVLAAIDPACTPHVTNLAIDEIFLGAIDQPWSPSNH